MLKLCDFCNKNKAELGSGHKEMVICLSLVCHEELIKLMKEVKVD